MKSANALLELPAGGILIPDGTSVSAIVIFDLLSSFITKELSSHETPKESVVTNSKDLDVRVTTLTVGDTVSAGAGPDRSCWSLTSSSHGNFLRKRCVPIRCYKRRARSCNGE
ncbi:hypothetical protein RND81_02G022400 [Saponaria officinalis]|uniref:Uncharacterized protein n=1 Tax=Saponaria officinalis TaxID=3572 RepID=A0AAW1MJ51_SAPOF